MSSSFNSRSISSSSSVSSSLDLSWVFKGARAKEGEGFETGAG